MKYIPVVRYYGYSGEIYGIEYFWGRNGYRPVWRRPRLNTIILA